MSAAVCAESLCWATNRMSDFPPPPSAVLLPRNGGGNLLSRYSNKALKRLEFRRVAEIDLGVTVCRSATRYEAETRIKIRHHAVARGGNVFAHHACGACLLRCFDQQIHQRFLN